MRNGTISLDRQDNSAHLKLTGTPTNGTPTNGDVWLTGTALNLRIGGLTRDILLPSDFSIASQVQGDVLYFNGTNWVRLAPGTSGQFLRTSGAAANPVWATASTIATDLSIAGQVQGDIIYFNGTNWVRLAPGTAGQKLQTNGAAANPSWVTVSAGVGSSILAFVNADLTAGVLTHTHSLSQQYVQVQVFDNNNKKINPDDITLTSSSVSTIDLTSFGTLTGTWHSVIQG